jgi:hypothetical protein
MDHAGIVYPWGAGVPAARVCDDIVLHKRLFVIILTGLAWAGTDAIATRSH